MHLLEWNAKKDRTVSLHRHPCFVGGAESVMQDCCGDCPEPKTDYERLIAAEEAKIYVSGKLEFMKHDPGRQTIGSFNPLDVDGWTEMAYLGSTAVLCHAISNNDIHRVREWCETAGTDVNRRDHTGRTPLQLAVQCSTIDIVQYLVDHKARLVARMYDGTTALHIAAARGNTQMVQALLDKSEANKQDIEEKQDAVKKYSNVNQRSKDASAAQSDCDDEVSDIVDASSDDSGAVTQGSFVKVEVKSPNLNEGIDEEEGIAGPDVYAVDVLAWDAPVSPLHLAILNGHQDVVQLLVKVFGSDVLLPVKLADSYTKRPVGAIMTLVLAAQLADNDAAAQIESLLQLGATSLQADINHVTAFHFVAAAGKVRALKAMLEADSPAASKALDYVSVSGDAFNYEVNSPLTTAISRGDIMTANALIDLGAKTVISYDSFTPTYASRFESAVWKPQKPMSPENFSVHVHQPIIQAAVADLPSLMHRVLDTDVDINTLTRDGHKAIQGKSHQFPAETLLDVVKQKLATIDSRLDLKPDTPAPFNLENDTVYLGHVKPGTYEHWWLSGELKLAKGSLSQWHKAMNTPLPRERLGEKEQDACLRQLREEYAILQARLLDKGAKSFEELYPESVGNPTGVRSQRSKSTVSWTWKPRVTFDGLAISDERREDCLKL